jgi:lipid-A-disaccharide synthase-like uncharacterized protein
MRGLSPPAALCRNAAVEARMGASAEKLWLVVGLVGQALFALRFLVQWITSEKVRRSVIPRSFWYFSIAGSVMLLAYAIYRADPVFILGQATGVVIYLRNLVLLNQPSST